MLGLTHRPVKARPDRNYCPLCVVRWSGIGKNTLARTTDADGSLHLSTVEMILPLLKRVSPGARSNFPRLNRGAEDTSMPKYFIDLQDASGIVRDHEGAQYEHVEDALNEAKASARDLVRQYMDNRISLRATCVEVRDVQGRPAG